MPYASKPLSAPGLGDLKALDELLRATNEVRIQHQRQLFIGQLVGNLQRGDVLLPDTVHIDSSGRMTIGRGNIDP